MKIRISYFYQIRNFKPNMIPMSTAISDPSWFHDWKDSSYIFTDKRGILNGLRLKPIIVQCGGRLPLHWPRPAAMWVCKKLWKCFRKNWFWKNVKRNKRFL